MSQKHTPKKHWWGASVLAGLLGVAVLISYSVTFAQASPVTNGICIVRNGSTSMPVYSAADLGNGYAKISKPGVNTIDGVKTACTRADFDTLLQSYCTSNSTSVQEGVATFRSDGTVDTSTCGSSGCDYKSCPAPSTALCNGMGLTTNKSSYTVGEGVSLSYNCMNSGTVNSLQVQVIPPNGNDSNAVAVTTLTNPASSGTYGIPISYFPAAGSYLIRTCLNGNCTTSNTNGISAVFASGANTVTNGICIVRNSTTSMPVYSASNLGNGYAKISKPGVTTVDALKTACSRADFDTLLQSYCTQNSTSVQEGVATFRGDGTVDTSTCGSSGCDYKSCPAGTGASAAPTLQGTIYKDGQYIDPATATVRTCPAPNAWMKEGPTTSGARGFHCMPNYTPIASDAIPSGCTGTVWAGTASGTTSSMATDTCGTSPTTGGTTTTSPTACATGQTCPSTSWCEGGNNQRCYKPNNQMSCVAMSQTCASVGGTSCSPTDTNCLEPGATGSGNSKWCSNSMKCFKKGSATAEFMCGVMGANGVTAACASGYSHCDPSNNNANCVDIGESSTNAAAYCSYGQKCNLASGGITCVSMGDSCPTGAKLCGPTETNCVEPGTYAPYSSTGSNMKYCSGGAQTVYSRDNTQIFCIARTQTQMMDPNWVPTVPAGFKFCMPSNTQCIEPGQSGPSTGWCGWMPPGAYTAASGYNANTGATRTCPAVPGYTAPVVTPVPTTCQSGQISCPAAAGGSYCFAGAVCPPATPTNANWVKHNWYFADGNQESSFILNRTDKEYTDYISAVDASCKTAPRSKLSWKTTAGDDRADNWRNFGIPDCSGTPVPTTCQSGQISCPSGIVGSYCFAGTACPPAPTNTNWVKHNWYFADGNQESSFILNRTDKEYTDYIAAVDASCKTAPRSKFSWKTTAGDDRADNWRNFGIPDCGGMPQPKICPAVMPVFCPSGQYQPQTSPDGCVYSVCRPPVDIIVQPDLTMCRNTLRGYYDEVRNQRLFLRDVSRQISGAPDRVKTQLSSLTATIAKGESIAASVEQRIRDAVKISKCSNDLLNELGKDLKTLRDDIVPAINDQQEAVQVAKDCQYFEDGLQQRISKLTKDADRFAKQGDKDFAAKLKDNASQFADLQGKADEACKSADSFALDDVRFEMSALEDDVSALFKDHQQTGADSYVDQRIADIRKGIDLVAKAAQDQGLAGQESCVKAGGYVKDMQNKLAEAQAASVRGDRKAASDILADVDASRDIVLGSFKQCGLKLPKELVFSGGDVRDLVRGISGIDDATIEKIISQVVDKVSSRVEVLVNEKVQTMLTAAKELNDKAMQQLMTGVNNLHAVLAGKQAELDSALAVKGNIVADVRASLDSLTAKSVKGIDNAALQKSMETAATVIWCGDVGAQVQQKADLVSKQLAAGELNADDATSFGDLIKDSVVNNPQACYTAGISKFRDPGMSPEQWYFSYFHGDNSVFKGKYDAAGNALGMVEPGRKILWVEGAVALARGFEVPNVNGTCATPSVPGAGNVAYGACALNYFVQNHLPLPNHPVNEVMTRGELAAMVVGLAGDKLPLQGDAKAVAPYRDVDFKTANGKAIASVVANGVMFGKDVEGGKWAPNDVPNRAEVAAVWDRLSHLLKLGTSAENAQ